jgi:hypothetical protein
MSKDNFSTPEGMAKVIHLQSDKNANLLEFAIVHDDAAKELTFNLSHYLISKIFFFFSISFL